MRSPWWQSAVIYQIYPRSFQDTTGNGIGDLEGIRRRVPYLAETLGVDAVWLSPFYPSPQKDLGYDVSDYTDVDPQYGTLDDFDRLRSALHDAGLKLIVDWVPNHSSDQHEWFRESRGSRNNPKRDWYVWKDAGPGGGPPNNWLSNFGGPAWEFDVATGQYYLHSFLKEQPDLNWRNPQLREAMLDTLRFWLDRGVDGFRIDVAHYMMKDPALRSNPAAGTRAKGSYKDLGEYETQLHVYNKGHDDIHDVFRAIRSVMEEYDGDRLTVGEIHEYEPQKWASYYGSGDGLSMPLNFALLAAEDSRDSVASAIEAVESVTPEFGWPNYVWGNHDERRITSRFDDCGARRAAVLLLTLRGTPTMYYGDEIGMLEADVPPELAVDPWGKRVPGLGRDGARTPMQWVGQGGFSSAAATWLPMGPDTENRNVDSQVDDPASMLTLYRRLLEVRSTSRALQIGALAVVDSGDPDVFVFQRQSAAETVTVMVNYADGARRVAGVEASEVLVSSDPARLAGNKLIELSPGEALVVR